jgi:CHAT domain-containing protein
VKFETLALDRAEVRNTVALLRAALDLNVDTIGDIPKFNLPAAYGLYQKLLAPVEPAWKEARHLIVVPHRELAQLPIAMLPTVPPPPVERTRLPFEGYRRVKWLARAYAVTYAPSASAYAALGAISYQGSSRREFVGIGDPYFAKEQVDRSDRDEVESRSVALRDLRVTRIPPSARPPGVVVRNSSRLAQLPRLPETADEIRNIAQALSADITRDVFIGEKANERTVKSGVLENRRIVVFATHGLVSGELDGLHQPALALSAPDVTGDDKEDGLLTMEEILGLKLQADWVVLSACNTAAGAEAGADAVSGLGRAFFYAGARSLLVTHWAVESTSAMTLTVDLFKRQAANPGMARSEALRQTMVAMIDSGVHVVPNTSRKAFSYAHPVFWAPFTLVGDGTR